MDRKIVLYVLSAAVLGFMAMMLFPGHEGDPNPKLPWDIAADAEGRVTVFTLTLGKSTLADARRLFGDEEGKVSLFARAGSDYVVEAYFERIYLSGLRADFIITIDAGPDTAAAMYNRGLRISQLPSGSKKVKMAADDLDRIARLPIRHITYLPAARLDEDLIESRFGKPEEEVREESGINHWLYSHRGLDIGRDADGSVVIQYLNPEDFRRAVESLHSNGSPPQRRGPLS